jgi:hypothetical protein
MAGQLADAQRLVSERSTGNRASARPGGVQTPFWTWMRDTFGIAVRKIELVKPEVRGSER